jgi:phosphopantetheinyl transferase (holo-ACP synthase)
VTLLHDDGSDGVLASASHVLPITEVAAVLARGDAPFSPAELGYARSKSDPERRLAARLAAKRAAVSLLGADARLSEVEVLRARGGAPQLRLTGAAGRALAAAGADRALVSLTHGREHAAAVVLLVRNA